MVDDVVIGARCLEFDTRVGQIGQSVTMPRRFCVTQDPRRGDGLATRCGVITAICFVFCSRAVFDQNFSATAIRLPWLIIKILSPVNTYVVVDDTLLKDAGVGSNSAHNQIFLLRSN